MTTKVKNLFENNLTKKQLDDAKDLLGIKQHLFTKMLNNTTKWDYDLSVRFFGWWLYIFPTLPTNGSEPVTFESFLAEYEINHCLLYSEMQELNEMYNKIINAKK